MSDRRANQLAAEATARAKAKREVSAPALAPDVRARWAMELDRLDAAPCEGDPAYGLPSAGKAGFALALEAFEAGREGDTLEELSGAGRALRAERRDEREAARNDPIRVAEREMRQERIRSLSQVRKQLGRRLETVEFDPLNAMARGLITEGKHLRALSPTPELGLLAVPYRNRGALISPRQLAAFGAFHAAWLSSQVGVGAVDAARIRVDGGAGGDSSWRLAKAADSLRAFKAMRIAVGDAYRLQLVDHVVLFGQAMEGFSCPAIEVVKDRKMQAGMRLSMLLAAADAIARQVWG